MAVFTFYNSCEHRRTPNISWPHLPAGPTCLPPLPIDQKLGPPVSDQAIPSWLLYSLLSYATGRSPSLSLSAHFSSPASCDPRPIPPRRARREESGGERRSTQQEASLISSGSGDGAHVHEAVQSPLR
ncbi:hypothetical protein GUJ93_ZPchr0010g9748 [Zizania palustris]|uniref:Uncharacterized protein n=1 Tax=Zizania palustris TaxID=103762 RepID=A0A8J5W999_ZIZPA|nr:hypothetical protein GUJ93_ZPchr0010g9748 [Zizania palustris]